VEYRLPGLEDTLVVGIECGGQVMRKKVEIGLAQHRGF
jgi:hypothetical protein